MKTKYGKIHTVNGIFYFEKYGTKLKMYRTVPPLDIFQLGIVLWSLFCDAAHPYEIDSDTLRTIQNPTTPSRLLSALWTMQTKNIGIPSAIEWEELQNFRIPNVQINMQDEQTRISLMNQLRVDLM